MPKRGDEYQMDPDDSGATDYKWRRKSEEGVDRDPDNMPANQTTSETPNEAMETTRKASEKGRREELERAREAGEEKERLERMQREGKGMGGTSTQGRTDMADEEAIEKATRGEED